MSIPSHSFCAPKQTVRQSQRWDVSFSFCLASLSSANDCKLFASYCSTAPCKCLPLNKGDPNPVCGGQTVQCLIAPCLNKIAVCSDAGTCAVGP